VRDVFDLNLGKKRTLWAFVGVLGFSRFMSVRLVWTNDVPTTIEALESILKEIGGVPRRLTSDNPKCFALEASMYEPLLNPALERFTAHYETILECLPPADPQKKGKVERQMPFVRRLFEAYDFSNFQGIEHAQNYINKKCSIANERVHGTTRKKPLAEFVEHEAPALKALPSLAYEIEDYSEAKVRRDGFVRFNNKHYAVPDYLIGFLVQIIANKKTVTIFQKGKLIESYDRITDPHVIHATKDHLKKSWERVMHDHGHYLKRAEAVGPNVARIVSLLLEKNLGFVDTRKVWGILSLDKSFAASEIDEACRLAIVMNRIGHRPVLDILKSGMIARNRQSKGTATAQPIVTPPPPPPKFGVSIADYKAQLDLSLN
jgi:hypothetical protein